MKYLLVAASLFWLGCSKSSSTPTDNGRTFDPCVADPKPGFDPGSRGLTKCCDQGPAHCVPSDDVLPKLASELDACPDGTSVCMPDPIIRGGGQFMPAPCTSSVGNAAGVCLSDCIPLVAHNPQSALLGQDGCGDGELCVPCKNPVDGTSTGACDLVALLCSNPDAGSDGGGMQQCPYTGPPLIDPTTLPDCAPVCGGAHCLPASTVPAGQQSLLAACSAANGAPGLCAPDDLIKTGGNFIPPSCTSVAGAEGRCLSVCLPEVAAQAALLPSDVCAAGQKCVPCFNPTAQDPTAPTGACTLACDKPSQPPVVLSCPWTGPKVVEPTQFPACDPSCYGAHCVPSSLVPASLQSMLSACAGGFCTPDTLVAGAGDTLPATCRSIAGAEGRCLSTCLPQIAAQADVLPRDTCAQGEVCAPCFDPTAPSPQPATGACTLACDQPAEGPLEIACPYTGDNLLDPTQFPDCSSATCTNAHCLPARFVPAAQQALLQPCPEGGYCAPDAIIGSLNHFVPKSCTSVAGVEGRCVSTCLPSVELQASLLPTAGCEDQPGTVCAPCYDPTSANWMTPTGACSIGCDMPVHSPAPLACPYPSDAPDVVKPSDYPSCASGTCMNAHCLPGALVPHAQQALLAPCTGGFCTPDEIIRSDNHWVPKSCTSLGGYEGRCVSTCLPSVEDKAAILPTTGCEDQPGTVCAPCYDPTSADWSTETGACSIGCDHPLNSPSPIACPFPTDAPHVIDPSRFPSCASATCANAHCLPGSLLTTAQQEQLGQCQGGGYCTPDEIIESAGNFVPKSCTSIAGAEGRCLSTCLPEVASLPGVLPTAGCPDGTACAPCYNPTSSTPTLATGACSLAACDHPDPSIPPVILACQGPTVPNIEISVGNLDGCGCSGAHCLPTAAVPARDVGDLDACDVGTNKQGYCTPDTIIESGGLWKPSSCTPFANITASEGRCLSDCLTPVKSNPTLETASCDASTEKCVPCWDPFSGADTGACDLAPRCDSPTKPKYTFPTCCDFLGNGPVGTCVPLSQLDSTEQSSLPDDTCSSDYKCAPNEWLPSASPILCTTTLGFSGSCVPRCINNSIIFSKGTCPTNDFKCVACFLAPKGTPGC